MIAHLYKITNNLTNQYYIGKRRGSEQGRYWGSGLRIKRHIKKYGKENFTYDVSGKNNPFYGKKHPKEIMYVIKYKVSKDYVFISPENKVFKGRNLVDFCKQMKLSYDSMYLILRGKQAVHKGWRAA